MIIRPFPRPALFELAERGWTTTGAGLCVSVQITNFEHKEIVLTAGPYEGRTTRNRLWTALDIATGKILWQMSMPGNEPVAVAMGPFIGGQWRKGSKNSAPSIVDGALYWGSGYPIGTADNKLYKFGYSAGCAGSVPGC